jgi:hypothetical protein
MARGSKEKKNRKKKPRTNNDKAGANSRILKRQCGGKSLGDYEGMSIMYLYQPRNAGVLTLAIYQTNDFKQRYLFSAMIR